MNSPQRLQALGARALLLVAAKSIHPVTGRFVSRRPHPQLFKLIMAADTGLQLTVWLRNKSLASYALQTEILKNE